MSRPDLAAYRMARAKDILTEAQDALKQKRFALAVNRSYYAMFASARALLAMRDLDGSKHSGVISLFNRNVVKTGEFPAEVAKMLAKAKDIREEADYRDFADIGDDDAREQMRSARRFVAEAEKALSRMAESTEGPRRGGK